MKNWETPTIICFSNNIIKQGTQTGGLEGIKFCSGGATITDVTIPIYNPNTNMFYVPGVEPMNTATSLPCS